MSSTDTTINTNLAKFQQRLVEILDLMKAKSGTAPLLIIENLSLLILQYSCSPVFQMLESLKPHVNGFVLHAKSSISALLSPEEKVMTQSFASVYIETLASIQARTLHSIHQDVDTIPTPVSLSTSSTTKDSTKNHPLVLAVRVHMNRIIGRSIEKHLQWALTSEGKLITLSKSISTEIDGLEASMELKLQSFMQEKSKQKIEEETGATFKLTLTEKQRSARAAASVPFASARNVGVGETGITLEEDDDEDYEVDDDVDDPDDDLDI
jgi:hypothetical protein